MTTTGGAVSDSMRESINCLAASDASALDGNRYPICSQFTNARQDVIGGRQPFEDGLRLDSPREGVVVSAITRDREIYWLARRCQAVVGRPSCLRLCRQFYLAVNDFGHCIRI